MKKKTLDILNQSIKSSTDLTAKDKLQEASKEKKPSERGLKDGYTRFSFVVNKEDLERLKAVIWYERRQTTEVMAEALEMMFSKRDVDSMVKEYKKHN